LKVDEYDKENVMDFALWKKWDKNDGNVYWEGDLPKGRPGWHIECSAMSIKYLGETIDIHSGAVDLIFPHHENEIAQSEAYTGKKFVNYWLHPEHLLVGGKKMSKSLYNFYTIRDLETLGFDPMSFRLMSIDFHYRDRVDFTMENLKRYETTLDGIDIDLRAFKRLTPSEDVSDDVSDLNAAMLGFEEAINKDLNTHVALENFFKIVALLNEKTKVKKVSKTFYDKALDSIAKMDSVLGIIKDYDIPKSLVNIAEERKALRALNKWGEADAKRKIIKDAGFKIIDLEKSDYIILKERKYGR
jgi:cysteinyl-tRNA synthetase